jgi:photosystem II stability/assembly factor-like uncharacterized protein
MSNQPDSSQSRLSSVWDLESARELAARYPLPLAGAAAGLVLLITIVVFFATGASADFEPVDSLNHEYNSNHIHGIAYDHEQKRLLIATHFGLFAFEDDQLFQVGDTRDDLMGLTMNPQDPQEVYLSGHPQGGGNLGVLRSRDGGVTLERIFTGVEDETVDFHSMSVSPADPDWLYGFFNGQLYRTLDGGEAWNAFVAAGIAQQGMCWGVPCLAASVDDPATIYAGTAQGLLKSTDGGARFEMVNFEIGQTAAVAVDPSDPDRILAYTEALGMAVTPDGGGRWQGLHGDLQPVDQLGVVFQIAINAEDASHMFIATMDMQIYETTDGGQTWHAIVQS